MSSLLSRLGRSMGMAALSVYGWPVGTPAPTHWQRPGIRSHKQWLEILKAIYQQNDFYRTEGYLLYHQGIHREALTAMRLAGYRCVEFYTATVWPGTLPAALKIEAENEDIVPAIHQVWQWSDWERQKQVMVRHAATYGDSFVKVAMRPDNSRVFFQLIDPSHVVDFDVDERGFLTWIRIDIPQSERTPDGKVSAYTHTEVWDRSTAYEPDDENGVIRVVGRTTGRRRIWKHTRENEEDLARLGEPEEERPLSDFGIDFIPIDHCMFRDVGELWGMGAYAHTIEKQVEGDREATRLAQMLYRHNKETHVLQSPNAIAAGRPTNSPPPKVDGVSGTSSDTGAVDVPDDLWERVPAGWEVVSRVPQLQYDAALAILNAHLREIEMDLPELGYYRMTDWAGDPSGRSVRLRLSAAIDRAIEARGNLEASLIRCNAMALTMGANAAARGVPGMEVFATIGTYEAGDFAHSFKERDVLPADALEDAQALKAEHEGRLAEHEWLNVATPFELERAGFSDDEIRQIEEQREASEADAMERELTRLERGPRLPAPQDTEEEGNE